MSAYIAIDLKSFYASVECVDRGLDPLNTNLVVADKSRTDKTICLAVSPPLKAFGISGRARLFEVISRVAEVNAVRRAANGRLEGKSVFADVIRSRPEVAVDYIVAAPRMARYIESGSEIYGIYLKYIAPEDIHVYSVDEVFIDVTHYLGVYGLSARELAQKIIRDVLEQTGITATAGIGDNLYLCKIAMDIVAKKMPADEYGARIAELSERSYREKLWEHRPITDFWRVGAGYARSLARRGMFTMGDVARCSIENSELLYKLFGKNAELLIDHAWGRESCTMDDIKSYKPQSRSLSSGQVLSAPYKYDKARLIIREMAELLALELLDKRLMTDQIVLSVGYDKENLKKAAGYSGKVRADRYGRAVPESSHGSENIGRFTSSTALIVGAVTRLFERIAERGLTVRRMYIVANHIIREDEAEAAAHGGQLSLFDSRNAREDELLARERNIQKAILSLHKRFGKNSVLKGMNLLDGATSVERNRQIGGHRA